MIPAKYWSPTKRLMLLGAMAGGKAVEDTATGNPLKFITDLAKPLKSLLIPFSPRQSGTGDPSPENIRSILPWDGLKVDQIGENAWGNGTTQNVTRYLKVSLLKPIPPGTYTITATVETDTASSKVGIGLAKGENMVIETVYLSPNGRSSATFTINETVTIVYLYAGLDYSLSAGYTATYKGILIEAGTKAPTETDISFPSPVYGGTLDVVSGVLKVEWAGFSAKWKNGVSTGIIDGTIERKSFSMPIAFVNASATASAYCNVAKWKWNVEEASIHFYSNVSTSYVFLPVDTDGETDIVIVGKLATPQEITLTPAQITALVGENTIWSDADGSMTAVYLKKG